jgi:Ca2+-binding RTX toxin-like protein
MTIVTAPAPGSAPPPAAPRASSAARRRRAAEAGRGVGATMSATFLGLLLIHGIGGARAEEGGPDDGGAAGGGAGGTGATAGGDATTATILGGWAAATPAIAAGSVLEAGGLIDPAALTTLAGEARFADGIDPGTMVVAEGDAPIRPAVSGAEDSGEPVQIAAAALPELPTLELPDVPPSEDDDGERLGDVGRVETTGDGDDTLLGTDADDRLDGGAGDDKIRGGGGNDLLFGGPGDDAVFGEAGDDILDGGPDNDLLDGGAGDDAIQGGAGDDRILGGAGNDDLDGGPGDDRIDGGIGIDRISGGPGNDILVVDHPGDLALETASGPDGGGIDTFEVVAGFAANLRAVRPEAAPDGLASFVLGSEAQLSLPSGANPFALQVHPLIENVRLMGGDGHDVLGDSRDNQIFGNDGDNRLYGGAGDDWLEGGAGDDWLEGGLGADLLDGGAGDDVFALGLSDSAVDTIFDHSGANALRLEGGLAERLSATLDGGDLRLSYDGRDLALIRDYVGFESHFSGIDLGQGVLPLDGLVGREGDILDDLLREPDQVGGPGDDILRADDTGQWLAGGGGDDTLVGGAGDDRLEGGPGNDTLRGGPGNDTYVFSVSDTGLDRIVDGEGRNTAEIKDYGGERLSAFTVGKDLWVTLDGQPRLIVEGHGTHPEAFAGVKAGERLVDPDELLS